MLSGSVYEIHLETKTCKPVISGLKEDSYKISDSNRMIAWKNNETESGNELMLLNLASKKQIALKQGSQIFLTPLGFMEEDLIYGMTHAEDIQRDKS